MPEPKTDRMFPVLESDPVLFRQLGCPRTVPWGMLESHEAQAQQNHSQSLQRLAERGGLGAIEMYAVLNDLPYRAAEARLGWQENRTAQAIAFIVKAVTGYIESQKRTLRERDPESWQERHARNVDKQRRRLLAARCSQKVVQHAGASMKLEEHGETIRSAWHMAHAEKLRTIAARLRGTE